MGAYGQESIRAAGLRLSLAGLGVLRILMSEDGLKAAEDLLRPRQPPGGVKHSTSFIWTISGTGCPVLADSGLSGESAQAGSPGVSR
jgi:hypothetical protein